MQVDKQPFLVNTIDLNGKKSLGSTAVADKEKGEGILIGDPRVTNENKKNPFRKVITEKTPDGGETLKITITSSSVGRQTQTGSEAKIHVLRIADGPAQSRGLSESLVDGLAREGGRSGSGQRQYRLRTFKPR
jgi:hypothetical protein